MSQKTSRPKHIHPGSPQHGAQSQEWGAARAGQVGQRRVPQPHDGTSRGLRKEPGFGRVWWVVPPGIPRRVVVQDAVALQDVLGPRDFPGEPAEVKGSIAGQQVGQVAWFAAAAASVILIALHDGFHLPLLAVGSSEFQSSKLKGDKTISNFNQVNKGIEVI